MATFQTTEYAAQLNGERVEAPKESPVHQIHFEYTQDGAGADGDDIQLCQLPAGKVAVLAISELEVSALGSSRELNAGFEAHIDSDGNSVDADPDALANDVDVSSATQFNLAEAGTHLALDSKEGVVLNATISGGTIPNGATVKGVIYYAAV